MRRQIIFIHGGTAFSEYENFLAYLRDKPIDDPLGLQSHKRWHQTLQEDLGEHFEVYKPSMPNSQNAKYIEWKIWFERYFAFLQREVILIGHSQGGYFLAKYLTENEMPIAVRALFLIAAPFESDDFGGEDGGDFSFNTSMIGNIKERVEETFVYHSKDDPVVPYTHAKKFKAVLPSAHLVTFEEGGHFLMEEFPALITQVKLL